MELGENEIIFNPRTSIKMQTLTYFIVEIKCHREVRMVRGSETKADDIEHAQNEQLMLHTDESSCVEGVGAA